MRERHGRSTAAAAHTALVLALALAGCSRADDDVPKTGGPPFETPGPPFETTGAPPTVPAPSDPCAPVIDEFAKTLARAPGTCAADDDCACYPGGVGEASGCGGVTDAKTATALHAISGRFLAAGCHHTVNCAPWMCDPKCADGRCSR
jgi:hypothetical protein